MLSRLAFHHLTFVPERDDVLVGRPDLESYALFPADGAALLHHLQNGSSPDAASVWYEASFGEKIDMEHFLATLDELGFLREENEPPLEPPPASVPFQRLGRTIFSPVATICYALIVIACVSTMARHGDVRPRPQNLFFSNSLVLVQIALSLGQLPGVLWHEAFHALAGRRLGVPSRLRLGRRLYFIVFETTLDGLLSVPRRKRYLPFVAGVLADVLFFSVLTLGADASRSLDGSLSWQGRLALALAYATLLRLAWQLYFFLRTDLYYVLCTVMGCSDLHGATRAHVSNRIWRLLAQPHRMVDESTWSPRDRAVARWYGPVAALGFVFLIGTAVLGVVPAMQQFVGQSVDALRGETGFSYRFWDAAFSALLVSVQIGGLFLISFIPWIRRRRHLRAVSQPDRSTDRH